MVFVGRSFAVLERYGITVLEPPAEAELQCSLKSEFEVPLQCSDSFRAVNVLSILVGEIVTSEGCHFY